MSWHIVYVGMITPDFLTLVADNKIPGYRLQGFQVSGVIDTTSGDVWGGPDDLIYPTAPEVWEISSDDVNDTLLGTGLRDALVISQDGNRIRQFTPVNMDGTNKVTIAGTHIRPELIAAGDSGVSGLNAGNITLQVQGGGDVRNVMPAGKGVTYDGHFSLASNETGQLLQTFSLFPKDFSGSVFLQLRDGSNPNSTWVTSGEIPVYQNIVTFEILARFPVAPNTDIRAVARTDAGTTNALFIMEWLIKEIGA